MTNEGATSANHQQRGFEPSEKLAAGSLLIAALTIIVSFLTARYQSNSEAEQNRLEFLRNQKQMAYADTIAQANKVLSLDRRALAYITLPVGLRDPNQGDYLLLHDEYEDQYQALLVSIGSLKLIGPEEVRTSATKLFSRETALGDVLFRDIYLDNDDLSSPIGILPDDHDKADSLQRASASALADFIAIAGEDVQEN